jgi:hypothetical protein
MARLTALFASVILALTATCAHAQTIACGFEQMDETQRQIAGEAFTTTDLLPRRAANAVISDAIAACPTFKTMTDAQIHLAMDYTQSASVLDLINARLVTLKAPGGLVDVVWAGLSDTESQLMLEFARGRSGGSDMLTKAVMRGITKVKANPGTNDAVTMGLAAKAIMSETLGRWSAPAAN